MSNYKLNYTGQEVNELLSKAAKSITSSDIAGLASEDYVDNAINNLDIPVVDTALNLESTNAIANKPVATALCPIDRYNVPLIDGQYGGQTWTENASYAVSGIAYGNDIYVAVGGKTGYTSLDGLSWTQSFSVSNEGYDIAFGNGIFVMVSYTQISTSTDGITWTNVFGYGGKRFRSVLFANNKFVVTSDNFSTYVSEDGTTWTQSSSGYLYRAIYDGTQYIGVGVSGRIMTTTTPEGSWTSQTSGTTKDLYSIAYGNGIYVAVGASYTLLVSYNSIEWTQITSDYSFKNIVFAGNQFIAESGSGIYSSLDGITWTERKKYGSAGVYTCVRSIGDKYFCSVANRILSSSNVFTAEGLALPLPITAYESNKVVKIKSPLTSTDTPLNINSLGAKTINGTIEQGKNYELVYNGASWDIKKDSAFNYQEIVVGETIFNLQKDFKCAFIGLIDGNMNAKIIPINTTVDLLTIDTDKKVTITTTNNTISVSNNTDTTQYIIYAVID